jgi:hypothetical protein
MSLIDRNAKGRKIVESHSQVYQLLIARETKDDVKQNHGLCKALIFWKHTIKEEMRKCVPIFSYTERDGLKQ